jgi:dipeptidyl aminopeptidase/acylaminoacyl peptidase
MTTVAPYGAWTSPISAADVAAGEAQREWLAFVDTPAGGEVWWTETRPAEGGRAALVRADGTDVLPAPWGVRSKVIEYGGRPWLPLGDGEIVFANWTDQRVYRYADGGEPVALTPESAGARYCDFARVGTEIWCLREIAHDDESTVVERDLVAIPLDGTAVVRTLAASHHLMTGPKVSPDGQRVAWLGWDHPAMPWDGTEVMCSDVRADGTLSAPVRVAGGPAVSVGQVEWAPDEPDTLYVLADPDGWWNVHEVGPGGSLRNLCARPEEFGEALWRIGGRWFLPVGGGRMFVVHGTGDRRLAELDADGGLTDIGAPYTEWAALATDGTRVAGTAANPRQGRAVVCVDPATGAHTVVRDAATAHRDYLPDPYHEVFDGVHAYVYPPHNPDFAAPAGELPPFLVYAHGGPTSRSHMIANQEFAYFTSLGFGVVDVQYGGSTGFGRAYRERLRGNWGEVDVRDCATAIRGLVAAGVADPARIGIRGGSAGGWTAAASLAAEPELYRVAGIYYPVLDPVEWRTRGTHDFESRYLDSLVGPWPAAADRYAELSPVAHAHRIRAPFVLLQGLDDTVCPPAQAEQLLARLAGGTVAHEYLTFPGEGHGFRGADTIVACLSAELALYRKVLLTPAGDR